MEATLGAWASHCSGFSRGAPALGHTGFNSYSGRASLVVAPGLSNPDSVVVVHGFCCSTACGIFSDQGSNPRSLYWQADSYPLYHKGSPAGCYLKRDHMCYHYFSAFFWLKIIHSIFLYFAIIYPALSRVFISKYVMCMTVENSSRDGNTRPPYLPPEKSVCRSGSNS